MVDVDLRSRSRDRSTGVTTEGERNTDDESDSVMKCGRPLSTDGQWKLCEFYILYKLDPFYYSLFLLYYQSFSFVFVI